MQDRKYFDSVILSQIISKGVQVLREHIFQHIHDVTNMDILFFLQS